MAGESIIDHGLRNEVGDIRARQSIVRMDMDLLRELIELREFRERHPLPPANSPAAKPKSDAVRVLEAHAVFGEYLDREAARLERKLQALDSGTFDAIAETDAEERVRNDAIGRRAVEIMERAHV